MPTILRLPFLAAAITLILGFGPAAAADRFVTLDEAGAGALLLHTDAPGRYVQAPLVASDVKVTVTGPIARVVVTQRFVNPSQAWVEADYVFPLPENSAVDTLRMRIGDRFVEGRIEERKKAREIYETARDAGKRAALVEQERPNLFRNSVANIGPGEVVIAQIEYSQALAPRDGVFALRVPLVVAPRFAPEPVVHAVTFGENGWAVDNGPDVAAPAADPRDEPEGTLRNPVTLSVDLSAGFDLDALRALYHEVAIERDGARAARITLTGAVPADRDFVLEWTPKKGIAPQAALLSERHDGKDHLILMLTPPETAKIGPPPPREVIFVQDVSGSMGGTSIEQARSGLALALSRLRPEDRFNIITFASDVRVWRSAPAAATRENVYAAQRMVRGLTAGGGTVMAPALEAALRGTPEDGRLRQIVFLTDGAVTNEAELFALIEQRLGRSRLFTVGIGSAPNGHFMVRAAEHGRGAHVQIGDISEVAERMEALFRRIETPALTDIRLELAGTRLDTAPGVIPDLYAGDPVVIAARADKADGMARLTGTGPDGPFAIEIPVGQAAARPGVAKLWARKRIAALETARISQLRVGAGAEIADREILSLALGYGLTSRLTSLVAVDESPARPANTPLTRAEIALNLPQGWDPEIFFAEPEPVQPLAPETEERLHRIKFDRGAPAPTPEPELAAARTRALGIASGAAVPQGSLNFHAALWLGILLILAGLALIGLARRGRSV